MTESRARSDSQLKPDQPIPTHISLPDYRGYSLRSWEERGQLSECRNNPVTGWRFGVEDPRTGERRGFANLERLVDFLRDVISTLDSDEKEK